MLIGLYDKCMIPREFFMPMHLLNVFDIINSMFLLLVVGPIGFFVFLLFSRYNNTIFISIFLVHTIFSPYSYQSPAVCASRLRNIL